MPSRTTRARSGRRRLRPAVIELPLARVADWRDGSTHIVMSPYELMPRLAALMPRPSLHPIHRVCAQLRFAKSADPRCANHGVMVPNTKLRALVVLRAPEVATGDNRRQPAATGESELPATESGRTHSRPAHISWARLLKRVSIPTRRTARNVAVN